MTVRNPSNLEDQPFHSQPQSFATDGIDVGERHQLVEGDMRPEFLLSLVYLTAQLGLNIWVLRKQMQDTRKSVRRGVHSSNHERAV